MLAQYTEKGQGLLGSGVELGGLFNKMKVDTNSYKNVIDDFKAINDFSIYLNAVTVRQYHDGNPKKKLPYGQLPVFILLVPLRIRYLVKV